MLRKVLLFCLLLSINDPIHAMEDPRFELGINTYQPADDFVNGSIRAHNNQFLRKFRVGYIPISFLGGDIQLHLDYQPNFNNNIGNQTSVAFQVSPDWVKSQHTSLGTLWGWKYFGFGPEIRSESYTAVKGTGQSLDSVRMNRLWWRFSLGYISPPDRFRLVARVELAGTNQVPSRTTDSAIPNVLKAMAPNHEYGLYAGVKF